VEEFESYLRVVGPSVEGGGVLLGLVFGRIGLRCVVSTGGWLVRCFGATCSTRPYAVSVILAWVGWGGCIRGVHGNWGWAGSDRCAIRRLVNWRGPGRDCFQRYGLRRSWEKSAVDGRHLVIERGGAVVSCRSLHWVWQC